MSQFVRRLAVGAGWLYSYRWIERLLDFLAIIVLARILTPDDFGLVAIAASIAAIIEGLSAFDVAKALIRARDEQRDLFDTAWTLSTLRGLISALIMVSIAFILSDDRIAAVVYALALTPLFNGLANPRFVLFERDLVYSKLAALTLGSKIVGFAVTVGLAIAYRNYWAIVFGMVVGALVSTVLSYFLRPYRPRISLARSRDVFAFSGWLSLTTLVTTLSMETDKLIVGRWLGVADAGRYFMTQRVGSMPTRELVSPLQRLLFPSFAELLEDRERLRRAATESINVVGSLSLAAGCGFAWIAGDFVPLVLGEQWLAIIPLLSVLVPFLGLRATLSMTLPCVMAMGRVQMLFWVSLGYAVVHIPAFVAGTIWFGLTGAIWSIVLAGGLYIYLNAWMLDRILGIRPSEILRALRRPALAVTLMIGALVLSDRLLIELPPFDTETLSPAGAWLRLSLRIGLGALVYGCALYGLWRVEGRPSGIERRFLQIVSRFVPGSRGSK